RRRGIEKDVEKRATLSPGALQQIAIGPAGGPARPRTEPPCLVMTLDHRKGQGAAKVTPFPVSGWENLRLSAWSIIRGKSRAEARMAKLGHVDTELVTASGQREQAHAPGPVRIMAEHLPVGLRRLAVHPVHMLARPVRPVDDQWQVDPPLLRHQVPPEPGAIG